MTMEIIPGPNPVFGTLTAKTISADIFNIVTFNVSTINATTINAETISSGPINGVTLSNNAWSSFIPTLGAFTGTITSASATGRYQQIGKTVFLEINISVATNGTAAGYVTSSLPVNSLTAFVLSGREQQVSGNMLQSFVVTTSSVAIVDYKNSYPASDGSRLVVNGVYEAG